MTGTFKKCMQAAKEFATKEYNATFIYEEDEFFIIHDGKDDCLAVCIVDWDAEEMPQEIEARQARRCLEGLAVKPIINGVDVDPNKVTLYQFAFHILGDKAFLRVMKHAQNGGSINAE